MNSVNKLYFKPSTYEQKKIAELVEKQKVEIKGIVMAVNEKKYDGCIVCRRKKCDMHNEGTREWIVNSFLLADASGKVWCSKFGEKSEPLEIGDELVVRGSVRSYRDTMQVVVYSLETLESFKVKKVKELIGKAELMNEEILVRLLDEYGVKWEEIESCVEQESKGIWRLKR